MGSWIYGYPHPVGWRSVDSIPMSLGKYPSKISRILLYSTSIPYRTKGAFGARVLPEKNHIAVSKQPMRPSSAMPPGQFHSPPVSHTGRMSFLEGRLFTIPLIR